MLRGGNINPCSITRPNIIPRSVINISTLLPLSLHDEEKAKCDGLHNGNDEIFVYYDIDEEKDKMRPLLSVLMMMMMMMVMVMRRKTRYDNCYIDDDDYQ